jgi:L-2-hydroxyglutarate oxidase LhgO
VYDGAVSSTPDIDVLVIGAGVVGLAVAARLAEAGQSTIVVERHDGPGRETSSRNSEVIHAGLYYPTGSLKARLCVRGNRLLYEYCRARGVDHRAIGKLIIAVSDDELPELERLAALGKANGVPGLRRVDGRELHALEPRVQACAAIHSASTGIIDSHGLLKALEAQTRAAGAQVLYRCAVVGVDRTGGGYEVALRSPAGEERLASRLLVNAAGLESDRIAALAGVGGYRIWWCKGDYFAVAGRAAGLVSRLVYPVPAHQLTSLGIHVTLDLGGRMRLGPDAAYLERERASLDVDAGKAEQFCSAVQRFLPQLTVDDLQPDQAGIRPKLQGPGDSFRDFVIREESSHDRGGLLDLVGIESPGLTACLAIAEEAQRLLEAQI